MRIGREDSPDLAPPAAGAGILAGMEGRGSGEGGAGGRGGAGRPRAVSDGDATGRSVSPRRGEASEAAGPGASSLARRLRARFEEARAGGHLVLFDSRVEVVPDGGIPFAVRVVPGLGERRAASGRSGRNPFLPYDPALHVADLPPDHVLLLNKWSVLPAHGLIVTRAFEAQTAPLGLGDFRALWRCLLAMDGLGFYNAGAGAGASQGHKHLQVVFLPLAPGPLRFPMEEVLAAAARRVGEPFRSAALPFDHRVVRLDPAWLASEQEAAARTHELYRQLGRILGLDTGRPYNLLATRELLWLVPRSRGELEGLGVNALGYAGALVVAGEAELHRLRELGPMELLRRVGEPG